MATKKKQKKKSNGTGKFFLGAALGAVAGGVAGVLTAPKSGKQTRKDIGRAGKKAAKAIESEGKKLGKKAEKEYKKVKSGLAKKAAPKAKK